MIPATTQQLENFLKDARAALEAAIKAEHRAQVSFDLARALWLDSDPAAPFSEERKAYNLAADALRRAREVLADARRWEAECAVDLATERRHGGAA